jgi:hypothetical protein
MIRKGIQKSGFLCQSGVKPGADTNMDLLLICVDFWNTVCLSYKEQSAQVSGTERHGIKSL